MGKIKIEDLPRDHKVSREEMRKIIGGLNLGSAGRSGGGIGLTNLSSQYPKAPFVVVAVASTWP